MTVFARLKVAKYGKRMKMVGGTERTRTAGEGWLDEEDGGLEG